MVITPMGAGDQRPTGWRCAELGAGVLVEGNPPSTEAMRAAVKSVLREPGYRARAQDLQSAIMQLPSLAEAVKRLETLSETQMPQYKDHHPAA